MLNSFNIYRKNLKKLDLGTQWFKDIDAKLMVTSFISHIFSFYNKLDKSVLM